MSSNISIDSIDSDVFYGENISNDPSPQRNNSPNILNSTQLSQHHTAGMPSVFSIAFPDHYIFNINDSSNEPTMPYGFGQQLPIVPPSLNDLNLPPNPLNILVTMAVANHTEDTNDDNYSPQSPEPSEPSPISTPLMNVSAFNSWETPYTTTGDDTFYSSDEPRRIYFLPLTPSPPTSPARKLKRDWAWECPFQKMGECSSTSAKRAVRRSPQQRTSQVHQAGIRDCQDIPNSLTNY